MKDLYPHITAQLPYGPGFCLVDGLLSLHPQGVEGFYHFSEKETYYRHHFPQRPVTPGVLLLECMAQIGVVCLGIFLQESREKAPPFALSESDVLFTAAVPPGSTVTVRSERVYWRLGKLKCKVALYLPSGKRACHGTLAGLLLKNQQEI